MEAIHRDNETWLAHLSSQGADQQAALSDLREALLRRLRRAVSPPSLADDSFLEDAVQDSLVRILGHLEQFEGRSRFLTWATSIAIRIALSELRRRRWKDVSLSELTGGSDILPERAVETRPGPDAQWERKSILEMVRVLIRSELTERQRDALLAELKGMPQDEIARRLGTNRNAVYKLTHDARKKLKRSLESAGYGAADIHAAFST